MYFFLPFGWDLENFLLIPAFSLKKIFYISSSIMLRTRVPSLIMVVVQMQTAEESCFGSDGHNYAQTEPIPTVSGTGDYM